MSGADTLQSFAIDLPDQDAAMALAGEAEATLHRLEALTGASLVLRGLSQQLAALAADQHLFSQLLMLFAATRIQSRESGLHVDRGDCLALLPEGAQQLHQASGPLQLVGAAA